MFSTAYSTRAGRRGDIKVSLAEVELLTIRIRLLICSIDKAEQIGLDWWKFDHHLSPGKQALSARERGIARGNPCAGAKACGSHAPPVDCRRPAMRCAWAP
jgi:hypothetical protein